MTTEQPDSTGPTGNAGSEAPITDEQVFIDANSRARAKYGRFKLAIVGGTGVGKSSLVNAVFGRDRAKVGKGLPVMLVLTKVDWQKNPITGKHRAPKDTEEFRARLEDPTDEHGDAIDLPIQRVVLTASQGQGTGQASSYGPWENRSEFRLSCAEFGNHGLPVTSGRTRRLALPAILGCLQYPAAHSGAQKPRRRRVPAAHLRQTTV
ncbi:MAG TPA: GTPase [Gryllotalpicola sp.]